METVLARWGNSLGLRLTKGIAVSAGFEAGDRVSIETLLDGICIKKIRKRPKYSLEELLSQITEENRHAATDWGDPKGREML